MVSMVGANSFEEQFREFLQEPETQEAVRDDQRKEMAVLQKIDDMEKLEELQGQREQLAFALQARPPRLLATSTRARHRFPRARCERSKWRRVCCSVVPCEWCRVSGAVSVSRAKRCVLGGVCARDFLSSGRI